MPPRPRAFTVTRGSRRIPEWASVPLLVVLGIVLVLGSPVLVPIAAYQEQRDARRRRAAAERTSCAACGRPLGAAAVDRADALWAQDWARWHAEHPGMIPRRVRHVWAACPHCGAQCDWDEAGAFVPVAADYTIDSSSSPPAPGVDTPARRG